MLAGNVVALLSPLIFIPALTFAFKPQKYDWMSMRAIRKGDDHDLAAAASVDIEKVPGERRNSVAEAQEELRKLKRASRIARYLTIFMTLALLILWPMPMYGTGYIFSKKFYTGWVVVGILWLFCSSICVGLYPLWEGRHTMARTFKTIYLDITGKKKPVTHGLAMMQDTPEAPTPPEKLSEEIAHKQ